MPKQTGFKKAEQEVVDSLLEANAVNFEAIGAALAQYGPRASALFDGDDIFCGTMRYFVRLFRVPDPRQTTFEEAATFRQMGELQ